MTIENILRLAADPNIQALATTIALGLVGLFTHKPVRKALAKRKAKAKGGDPI